MTPEINLLPWRNERRRRRWQHSLLALAASALIGLSGWWSLHSRVNARIQMQQQHTAALEQQLAEQHALLETRERHVQQYRAQNDARECLERQRRSTLRLFNTLADTIPDGVTLSALQQQGPTLSLHGRTAAANDLAVWLQRLQSEGAGAPTLTVLESGDQHAAWADRFEASLAAADGGNPCHTSAEESVS